jgi:ribosomal protein S18 acetylase RimI-like enzyme
LELLQTNKEGLRRLFDYWKAIGKDIPYFFEVTEDKWQECLFDDTFRGNPVFKESQIHYIEERNEIIGFIQFGQLGFSFGPQGDIIHEPDIGHIRHLYFNKDRKDVGQALMKISEEYFKGRGFEQTHGFYHAMGMSCNAGHGKLHHSMGHVEEILGDYGYILEHENIYYTKEIKNKSEMYSKIQLEVKEKNQFNKQRFIAMSDGKEVGTAEVAYLEGPTGGAVKDIIYLNWIGVDSQYKGQGLGRAFLNEVERYLAHKGYRYIHVDTASNNDAAKGLYKTSGFIDQGTTRSYLREKVQQGDK